MADLMAKQTEDFHLHVIEACNESMHLTVHRHLDTVRAFEQLEEPTQGWRQGGLIDVVRHSLMVLGSLLSQSTLGHGIHQQRQRHHHE